MHNAHCGRFEKIFNRRHFLQRAGAGFGGVALAHLLAGEDLLASERDAPSAVDMFDPKPELTKRDGQKVAIDVFNGSPGPLMKSPFRFKQHGQSGAWVCEKY